MTTKYTQIVDKYLNLLGVAVTQADKESIMKEFSIELANDRRDSEIERYKADMALRRAEFKAFEIIGKFNVTSGRLRVTDPCYSVDTYCSGELENVKNGEWVAAVKRTDEGSGVLSDIRVAELLAWHNSSDQGLAICAGEDSKIDVGVDSGQAGFFDAGKYVGGNDEDFYDSVCDLTLSERGAGIIEFGAVSQAGFGDGSYKCYTEKDNNGEVVAARIVFISDEDDDTSEP